MRKAFRGAVELALATSGLPALARRRRRGNTLVLAYHNVVPDAVAPFGDRSLHLPIGRFRRQLEALRETHEVVSLEQLDQPSTSGRPRAVITFDDAYAGALGLGVPAVLELGLPATIFVAPDLLGLDAMWWDLLGDPDAGLSPNVRTHALHALAGKGAAIIAWAREQGIPLHHPGVHARIGTREELLDAARAPGISLGLHTWSHPNLACLAQREIEEELVRCRDWMRQHADSTRPWLAYPYGGYSPAVVESARRTGVERAFRVVGGWVRDPGLEPLAIPRFNVPSGLSDNGFLLRISGVTPA